MDKLIPEYRQEIITLEEKMLDAQEFAEKFPEFSKEILKNKFTKEFTGKMADNYKGLYCGWGINRYFYTKRDNVTNYRGDFEPRYLWIIYINEYSLFKDYTYSHLYDIKEFVDIFFFDHLNTTFYATDEQIIPLLDALASWYEKAKVINANFLKEKKKKELMEQLEKLQ